MAEEAKIFTRAGYTIECSVCRHNRFIKKEAQLNTKVASLFDLDWVNPSGDCYICDNCRHIIWFYGEEEKLG